MTIKIASILSSWFHDKRGVTGLEYAFLGGAIGLSIAAGTLVFGNDMQFIFSELESYLDTTSFAGTDVEE